MFKRIKNLLDISRYTVEEVVNKPIYTQGYLSVSEPPNRPASIINMHAEDPFKEYETTEQSPDDTTPRN